MAIYMGGARNKETKQPDSRTLLSLSPGLHGGVMVNFVENSWSTIMVIIHWDMKHDTISVLGIRDLYWDENG